MENFELQILKECINDLNVISERIDNLNDGRLSFADLGSAYDYVNDAVSCLSDIIDNDHER